MIAALRRLLAKDAPPSDEARMRENIRRENERNLSPKYNPSLYFKREERIWMRRHVKRDDSPPVD